MNKIHYRKIFVEVEKGSEICLHYFSQDENKRHVSVLMSHGAIEDGRIFYSKSGKGLAPYLAQQGFDVFVMDGRGKGESISKIDRGFQHSQTDHIIKDLPFCIDKIIENSGNKEIHFVAHSWGGVLQLAFLARFQGMYEVKSMVFFGSKRRISIRNFKKFFRVDIVWNLVGYFISRFFGYAPFKLFKIGSENESIPFFNQMNHWVYSKDWKDKEDGFDYHESLQKQELPPALYLTGINDDILGNPIDVELLMKETGVNQDVEMMILGKSNGNSHDYGHIDIMTHKDAENDHFPIALDWMLRHSE